MKPRNTANCFNYNHFIPSPEVRLSTHPAVIAAPLHWGWFSNINKLFD